MRQTDENRIARDAAFILAVALAVSFPFIDCLADQPGIVARIGVLNPQTASASLENALREGLTHLGYVEGRNIEIEWRRSAGTQTQMRAPRRCLGYAANLAGAET